MSPRGGAALTGLLSVAGVVPAAGCGSDRAPGDSAAVRATAAAAAPSAGPPRAPDLRAGETLAARVLRTTALRTAPGGRVVARLGTRTRYGSPTTLPVAWRDGAWLGVVAPERPNGRLGWIRARDARLLRETWALHIELSRRRLVVRHQGRVAARFRVAVGAPGTATPVGRYGVTDRLRTGDPASPYGCCILALTGHQPHVAQGWTGGDRIAIHGTSNPASIGTATTHGCLRAGGSAMRWLMARIPLGTPVTIRTYGTSAPSRG